VPDYLADAFPKRKGELADKTDAGTRQAPKLETLATAKPDLILANDSLGDLYPKLSKIAPTVITAGNRVNWKRDLLLVGDAVGKGQQARKLLDDIAGEAKEKGAELGGDATEVSIVRFTPDRTRMFGSPPAPGPSPSTWGSGGRSRSGSTPSRRTSARRASTPPTVTGSSTPCRATPPRPTPRASSPDPCGSP
jgi:hypothetical protein